MHLEHKRLILLVLFLSFSTFLEGQIIKKHVVEHPTHLDSVYLRDEYFKMETLDSAYRYFARVYKVHIVYDTPYARRHYLNYWYMHTPLSRAIEITTRAQRLTYKIDSIGNVEIKRRGKLLEEDTVTEVAPVHLKYTGAPKHRSFDLNGKVIDFETGVPMSSVNIYVPSLLRFLETGSDGRFEIKNVPTDTVSFIATYVGYKPDTFYLNPNIVGEPLVVELQPLVNTSLEQVTIVGNKMEVMQASTEELSAIKMSPAKLAELPNVGEKDVMRALQLMPGVSAANESSSGLYVRGGTPDQNLVLFDGYTIYHVDHLYGFFSAFNSNALKDMQLFKGGYSAAYGGRLSSVTDITSKDADRKKFNLGGDASLLSGNIFTEIPLSDKISIFAAARRSWKGPIYNWIFNKVSGQNSDESTSGPGGATTETKSYFFDLNTKVTYRATESSTLSYSFFSSTDKLNETQSFSFGGGGFGGGPRGGNGRTDLSTYNNRGMSMQWQKKWAKNLKSNSSFSYSNYFSDRDRTNERTSTDATTGEETTVKTGMIEHNNLKDISAKTDFEWDVFKGNRLSFGAFASAYDIHYSYSQDDTSTLLNKTDQGIVSGAYIEDRYRFLHNHLELKPGIRYSYFDVTGKFYQEPRLSAGYTIIPGLSLRGSYGQFYQFVNLITREDVLNGNSEFWLLSDGKSVPVSKSTHYIGGLNYDVRGYNFSVEGYYKELQDITQYSLRFSSLFSSRSYSEDFYVGRGYSRGIEWMVQKKKGNFTGWVSYTLSQARNQFDVYGLNYYPANQDVTHEFKAVGIYKRGKWDYSATWIYASGRPYTAPGGSYQVTLLDGNVNDYFTVTSQNSLRLPAYNRLDLAVNRHLYNEKGKEVGYIGLSIFNAYNRKNIWYKQFYIEDSKITEVNVYYLGFTPNIVASFKIH